MTVVQSRLHNKLVLIRSALNGAIVKTGENSNLKFAFAEAVEVGRQFVEAATPLGVSMVPVRAEVCDIRPTSSGKQNTITLMVTWQLTDSESGESIEVVSFGQGADNSDKAAPKAQTNAMKYAILMIAQTVADDPEKDEPEPPKKRRAKVEESDEDGASDALKRKVRARQKELDLDDDMLKDIAYTLTGKTTSKEWTTKDADKILRGLDRESIVEAARGG